ncbi:MAG: hypothetical protein M0T70_12700 [Geobacteraceae bacterium]|nr:hypothetical protein [Geobacteraceae bacterium]
MTALEFTCLAALLFAVSTIPALTACGDCSNPAKNPVETVLPLYLTSCEDQNPANTAPRKD